MDKADFRKEMSKLRGNLPENIRHDKSLAIATKVIKSEAYLKCKKLLSFINMGSEPQTTTIIESAIADGKITACPNALAGTRDMAFYEIKSFQGLVKSKYGVLEPPRDQQKKIEPDENTLIIIPALAFDINGYRIGYGGGYYDTFLEQNPHGYRLGIAFCEMVMDSVPRLDHDKKIDSLITDREVYIWKNYK